MVFKSASFPWGLAVGWVLSRLTNDPMDHYKYITKRNFDFLIMSLFPDNLQRTGLIDDFLKHCFIKCGTIEIKQ
jgi:hypothetical protein